MKVVQDAEKAMPGEYVDSKLVKDWPRMSEKSAINFRRFTGANKEVYNLVRKGPRIFAVGRDLSKCVYNHTREF